MLKTIALSLVVVIPSFLGFGAVQRLRNRMRTLTAVISALEVMRGEIITRLTPVPELVNMLRLEAPEPARVFFSKLAVSLSDLGRVSFAALWARAAESSLDLGSEELGHFASLGAMLGRYDADEQRVSISHTISRLERCLDEAKTDLSRQGPLFSGLGVSLGLLLAVVLA